MPPAPEFYRPRRRKGATATELAVLLPLLVFICMAAVDLGRYATRAIALENAVRVGAEYGASRKVNAVNFEAWEEELISRATAEFEGGANDNDVTLEVSVSDFDAERPLIEVSGNTTFELLGPWMFATNRIEIRRSSAFQRYR